MTFPNNGNNCNISIKRHNANKTHLHLTYYCRFTKISQRDFTSRWVVVIITAQNSLFEIGLWLAFEFKLREEFQVFQDFNLLHLLWAKLSFNCLNVTIRGGKVLKILFTWFIFMNAHSFWKRGFMKHSQGVK